MGHGKTSFLKWSHRNDHKEKTQWNTIFSQLQDLGSGGVIDKIWLHLKHLKRKRWHQTNTSRTHSFVQVVTERTTHDRDNRALPKEALHSVWRDPERLSRRLRTSLTTCTAGGGNIRRGGGVSGKAWSTVCSNTTSPFLKCSEEEENTSQTAFCRCLEKWNQRTARRPAHFYLSHSLHVQLKPQIINLCFPRQKTTQIVSHHWHERCGQLYQLLPYLRKMRILWWQDCTCPEKNMQHNPIRPQKSPARTTETEISWQDYQFSAVWIVPNGTQIQMATHFALECFGCTKRPGEFVSAHNIRQVSGISWFALLTWSSGHASHFIAEPPKSSMSLVPGWHTHRKPVNKGKRHCTRPLCEGVRL